MNQASNDFFSQDSKRRNQRILLLMTAIIVIPFLLAYTMFRTGLWMPGSTTNQGILMLPPLHVDEIGLRSGDGESLDHQFSKGLWAMLIVGEGPCTVRCEEALYLSRQVHIALGKEASRVVRYYADLSPPTDATLAHLLTVEHPRLVRLAMDKPTLTQYLSSVASTGNDLFSLEQLVRDSYVLVVDPLGNIMMYYTPEHTGKQMLKDLKKLLKNSKIG